MDWIDKEFEVLYHGTKFKYNADAILKNGFNEMSFFAKDLNTAIHQGGKYVFEVVFLKKDVPDYWQVRCENKVTPNRIIRLTKYKVSEIMCNKKTESSLFSNATEFMVRKPYVFKERKNIDFRKLISEF